MQDDTQMPASPALASTAVGLTSAAVAPPAAVAPTQTVEFASFWARLAAIIIDSIIFIVIYLVVFFGLGIFAIALFGREAGRVFFFVPILLIILVYGYEMVMLLKFDGATLGKKAVGIKVISADGNKLTVGQVFLREVLGKFVSGLLFDIGYIWAAFDPQKQAWHDKIAKTFVIRK